jgi:nucleotide-binding universal stress UspA family protein
MNYRILVPLDGSRLADKVVPWADAWAESMGAELELLRAVGAPVPSVFAEGAPVADYYFTEQDVVRAHRVLEETAREGFKGSSRVDLRVMEGAAAQVILDRAHERAFDLIMMSTHGRGGLTRTLLGSIAGKVLRRAGAPVVTVRADLAGPPRAPKRVLVPINDSDLAAGILPPLVLFAKTVPLEMTLYWLAPGMADTRAGEAAIQELADGLRSANINTQVRIERGADPAAMIASIAHREAFDLIAMSTHARSGLGRWVLGSVTEWTIRHADVPVMAIRPQEPLESSKSLAVAGSVQGSAR